MNYLSKENVLEVLQLTHLKNGLLAVEPEGMGQAQQLSQAVYQVEGTINPALFQQAWDHVIMAHPELRSVYRSMKNRLVQVVLKTRPVPVEVRDLRGSADGAVQAAVAEVLTAQRAPMLPSDGPLLQIGLVYAAEQQAQLVWTYHPLILDPRSSRLVLSDWLITYSALLRGEPLPTLKRTAYNAYLTWLAEQDWSDVKADFGKQLAGFEAATQLLNGPRVHELAALRMRSVAQVSEAVSRALEELARRQGVTSYEVLHAAWAVLLNVYSGEDTVYYGATLAGHVDSLPGGAELIGRLQNTLPVRVQVEGEDTLAELLQAVREQRQLLERYVFLPLPELQEYGGVSAENVLFHSALAVYEPGQQPFAELADAAVRLCPLHVGGHAVPLSIEVELGEAWQVVFSVAPQAWEAETVERMQAHLLTLLEQMATQPQAQVRELQVLPEAERQQLFALFNRTMLPQPNLDRLAHQVIEEQAARRPDAVACLFAGQALTYRELNERANRLAHWLRAQGFGRDDLAALFLERGIDMLVAIVAALKAGGAYVPLDTAHPDARLRTILENSRAKVLFTQRGLTARSVELAAGLAGAPLVFCLAPSAEVPGVADAQVLQAYSQENPVFINQPGDLANVFFTSGSTGLPKGAMIEQIGMLNHLYAKINLLGLAENSVVVQNASHCFDISVWQFLAPLMTGGTVAIYGNEVAGDPQALLAAVQRDRATVLEMVPAMIEMFLFAAAELPEQERALPELQYMISTGEGLPVPLMRKWLQAYPQVKVVNTYGATECSDDTSHEVVDHLQGEEQNYVTLGKPIPNFKTYLLDRWNRPVPIGCVGEICLTGIGVGRGYLNDPERTAKAFVQNPFADGMGERMYRTGDLGRYLPSGELLFVSRIDHQVKVRGHRIELGEIESVLRAEQAVQLCIAVVKPDNHGQNRILAYVVGEGLVADDLRAKLQTRLPEYMIPEQIILLAAMPLNRNGKIDRNALPDPQEADRAAEEIAAPRNEIETALVAIWQEVLGTSPIGITDNFFLLGGHSLRTVQVRSRIKHLFGVDVPLKMLFDLQTVAELGAWIAQMQGPFAADGAEKIPRAPLADVYPMSHAQRRLYFLQQLEPGNCAFNMPNAFRLEGPLVLKAFRQALQRIVDRHASLRTTFALVDGEPVQRVAAWTDFAYQAVDLSKRDAAAREQALQAYLTREMREPFDLENGPLFRVRVLRLSAEEHVIVMNMHHIISDLGSWRVLQEEFASLYLSLLQGAPEPVPPLAIQYVDFTVWQNQRLANGELAAQERYWLEKLAGELPVLQIPTDFPRPARQQFNGSDVTKQLPRPLVAGIRKLVLQSESTLFMVLLAATGILLHRLSGQQDLIIGTPEAGRNRMELEALIGFFINTLPLRLDVQPEDSFLTLLAQVKRTALEAYEQQEYPFDQLVDKLNPVRDISRPPILSVMFQVVRHEEGETVEGLRLSSLLLDMQTSQIDLYLGFHESEQGLEMIIDYSTDLYRAETVTRWLGYLETILTHIVAEPERKIAELPLVTVTERERWLATAQGPELDVAAACLHELFAAQAERTPEAEAVVSIGADGREAVTYAELNRRANRVAHHLQKRGVGPEQVVAICMEPALERVVAVLGVLQAGAAYLPLDPRDPAERIAFQLLDAQANVLLTQTQLVPLLTAEHLAGVQVIECDASETRFTDEPTDNLQSGATAENLAYVLYTSGSTGQPKGVLVEHRSVSNLLAAVAAETALGVGSRVLQLTSFRFDPSVLEMFAALTTGATLCVGSQEALQPGAALHDFLRGQQITAMFTTPAVLRLLTPDDLPALQIVGCGGEAVTPELVERWASGRKFLNLYGPTEATVAATWRLSQAGDVAAHIGRPLPNVQAYVLDQRLQPVPHGLPGELYLGGACLARGYMNRPELTAERFVAQPYSAEPGARLLKTGDQVRQLPDGNLEFLGRLDEQVKIRGFRIEPGEVEAVLLQLPAVQQAVVLARANEVGDKRLVAYLVAHAEKQDALDIGAIRSHVQRKLPEFLVPAHFVVLDALPLTVNGKVDRRLLPAPEQATLVRATPYVAPRDGLELQLVGIWERLLSIRPIGVRDNFFAMGGHSLLAVRLLAQMQSVFGVEWPLSVLFGQSTVEALARLLRQQEEHALLTTPLVQMQAGEARNTPLFLVHPIGGNVLSYRELALALGAEQPVYGLQARGLIGAAEPLASVPEMAAQYVAALQDVQAAGPYHLGGWSFGGVVALEMAQQLQARGQEVATLALFDSYLPAAAFAEQTLDDVSLLKMFASELAGEPSGDIATPAWWAGRQEGPLEDALQALWQQAVRLQIVPQDLGSAHVRRLFHVFRAHLQAYQSYRPAPYAGDLLIFQTAEHGGQSADDWTEQVSGSLEVVALSSDHFTMMRMPHVEVLAERLRGRLHRKRELIGSKRFT